jgi:LytS/YehU family sensor histidine kinase
MPLKTKFGLYWRLQASGWILLALVSISYLLLDNNYDADQDLVYPIIAFCLGGWLLTHVFRVQLKRHKWLHRPLWQVVILIVTCNVLMAAILVGVITLWALAIGSEVSGSTAMLDLFGIGLNTTIVFLIWSLIYFTVYTFRNYRQEEIERLKAEQAMRESELARLKSQMNPHFVFNALNSIRALVAEDPEKAQLSLTQLSHLLRGFLLSDRHRTVTLAEEMRTVLDYLELEKLRYEHRLKYSITVAPEAEQIQVPTMMVQTLVENAIKHGISKTVEGGEIDIRALVQEGNMVLEIENSGTLRGSPFRQDGGFGLTNTQLRLQLLFAEKASIDIFQVGQDRVIAQVIIPRNLPSTLTLTKLTTTTA